jgi:hypothetical protein
MNFLAPALSLQVPAVVFAAATAPKQRETSARGKSGDFQGGYRVANGELTLKFSDNLVFVGTSCRPR